MPDRVCRSYNILQKNYIAYKARKGMLSFLTEISNVYIKGYLFEKPVSIREITQKKVLAPKLRVGPIFGACSPYRS